MSTKLWYGSFALLITAFTAKQYMWLEVSSMIQENRQQEHQQACAMLNQARESAKNFVLPPLSTEEKAKLKYLQRLRIKKDS
jgi:DNA-binding GntR family transcriptional regulator